MRRMAPKYHPTPLSGGIRKALTKELAKARAMTTIFAEQSAQCRAEGEALIHKADNLACQSWNERMWSDGGPVDPSPTVEQAINGGYGWLEIECSRCRAKRDVDLAALRKVSTTHVHDLASRLICAKCKAAGKRPAATLLQLEPRPRAADARAGRVLRAPLDHETTRPSLIAIEQHSLHCWRSGRPPISGSSRNPHVSERPTATFNASMPPQKEKPSESGSSRGGMSR